jgi:hypothetical protein
MRNILISSLLIFLSGSLTIVYADDADGNKGVEISTEHKSEQGLEHGKAYAGDKDKKEKDSKDKGDKEKGDKSKK